MNLTAAELARYIDHTLLAPDATPDQVAALIAEAKELGVYAICVSPSMLPLGKKVGPGVDLGDVLLATVVGFPSGKHTKTVKAFEAGQAVGHGAHEIDMVLDLGLVHLGDRDALAEQVDAVRREVPVGVVKVIIESAALTDDEIKLACQAALEGRADFVKTSTGFHPAGGASVHAVELMRACVGPDVGVKASGGIRDYATAMAMIDAGASRIGCSASRTILASAPAS